MNKRDFILLYPDVAKQEIEFKFVMAKRVLSVICLRCVMLWGQGYSLIRFRQKELLHSRV